MAIKILTNFRFITVLLKCSQKCFYSHLPFVSLKSTQYPTQIIAPKTCGSLPITQVSGLNAKPETVGIAIQKNTRGFSDACASVNIAFNPSKLPKSLMRFSARRRFQKQSLKKQIVRRTVSLFVFLSHDVLIVLIG